MKDKQQELIVASTAAPIPRSEQDESASILQVIARAAADPAVDIEKMQALLAMQERVMALRAKQEFQAALARIQPRMPRIQRTGEIVIDGRIRSRYSTYEDVDSAIRPLLAEEGFAISFDTESEAGGLTTILIVTHSLGHEERRKMRLPLDKSGSKNEVQSHGSTVSYAKRYLVMGFFNIVHEGEDNDGSGEPINLEQVNKIRDLLIYTNSDEKKFLAWLKATSVENIQRGKYEEALRELSKKAAKINDQAQR